MKVKIFLEGNETVQDAESNLLKALEHHDSGGVHSSHIFQDPAMASVADKMENEHAKIYHDMLQEIFDVLDQEYSK